jgi:hypothetical protein
MKSASSTVTLVGISFAGRSRKSAVTTISSMGAPASDGAALNVKETAMRIREDNMDFIIPFLRRHYPDQVPRVPVMDLRPERPPL